MHAIQLALLALALSLNYVQAATTSLFVPGLDLTDSASVDVLGVGPDQETTYEIQVSVTNTAVPLIVGTLVEGPSDAVFSAEVANNTVVAVCDISDGVADCAGILNGQTVSTFTTAASPIPVGLGATAAAPTQGSSSGLATSTGASNSQRTTAASQTGTASGTVSGSSGPSGAASPNGSKRIAMPSLAAIVGIGGMAFMVL